MWNKVKNWLKATETIVVLGGLFMAFTFGKFWIIATAVAYFLVNVPAAVVWLRKKINL